MDAIKAAKAGMETLVEQLKKAQTDVSKSIDVVSSLNAQLTENSLVKKELELMEEDGKVYKLIGPVLIKQDLEEARSNVEKRIDFIGKEIKRSEEETKKLEGVQNDIKIKLLEGQQHMQKLVAQVAQK